MQKDFPPATPRFQGAGPPQLIYPRRMPAPNAMQGQIRQQQQPYFAGPVQIPQPRLSMQQYQQAPVGGYIQSGYVPASQAVPVRHDVMLPSGYPQYVQPTPHGSSTPFGMAGYIPYAMHATQPVMYAVPGRSQAVIVSQTPQSQSQSLQQSQPQPGPTQPTPPASTQASLDNRSGRTRVVLRDPKDNRDVTSEILKRRSQSGASPGPQYSPLSAEEKSKKEEKDRIVAQFAAQVAAAAADTESQANQESSAHATENESESIKNSSKMRSVEKPKAHEKIFKTPKEHVPRILTKQSDPVEIMKVSAEESLEKKADQLPQNDDAAVPSNVTADDGANSEVIPEHVEPPCADNVEDRVVKPQEDLPVSAGQPEAAQGDLSEVSNDEGKKIGGSGNMEGAETFEEESKENITEETSSDIKLELEDDLPVVKPDIAEVNDVDSDTEQGQGDEVTSVVQTTSDKDAAKNEESTPLPTAVAELEATVKGTSVIPVQELNKPLYTEPDPVQTTADDESPSKTTELEPSTDLSIVQKSAEVSHVSTITSAEDDEVAKSTEVENIKVNENVVSSENESQSADDKDTKMINGHDQPNQQGSAFSQVPKKKKQKQRFKEMSAKGDKSDLDLMSAYVDKPPKEESLELEEPKAPELEFDKESEKAEEEEATWEDKEHEIEKESEKQVSPRVAATTIISHEDGNINENTKLQYDRDFLLKFQFASICTEKPKDLPNIEIVLNRAHEPTKLIPPGQGTRGQYNDFTPHYLKHTGGGRQTSIGGRGGKGGRGMVAVPKKIITSFENKVELKKSENAWVRPTVAADSLSEEERSKDELYRAVRGILNKLTPQKFETLVKKMSDLVIDTPEKLDGVIDLIFQKAIGEPGFSVAYANMCKVLAQNQQQGSEEGKDWAQNFRRILLNKCQKEFEKEKADEKTLLADREKEFEKPEEKKAWMEELELKEQKQRRKTLGNIRFIGELFKLQMLKETIMHQCIVKLLKSGDEDSTECLCKLLTTIGVDLDREVAKPRMKQYFEQMEKMTKQKKVSSRVKFMLQDVIELRESNWVPRREGEGPKTIDQIHEEAKIKEQKVQLAIQEDARQRKMQGGRDSPNVRTSVATSEDGWTVAGKSSRPQQLDPNKLRLTKRTDSDTISLGPGGRTGSSWARGAGMGLSRAPAAEDQKQENNRFSALSDPSPRGFDSKGKGPLRSLGGRRIPESRGSAPSSRGFSRDVQSDGRGERDKALAAARQLNTRTSRTPSPSVRLEEDRSSQTSSGPRTPSDSPAPTPTPPPNIEGIKEKIRKEAKQTVDEFIYLGDLNEAAQCVKDLNAYQYLAAFVSEAINHVLETKGDARKKVGKLLHSLVDSGVISVDSVIEGLNEVMEIAEDLATDIPYIWSYLGEIIGNFVYDGTVPLNRLKESVEPLIAGNKAGRLMAEILSVAVKTSSEEQIAKHWHDSGLTWESLLRPGEDVAEFIKDKKMDFIDKFKKQSSMTHASQVQQELRKLLQSRRGEADNEKIQSWIKSNVPETEITGAVFIRSLATAVCDHSIEKEDTRYVFNKDKFTKGGSSNLLMKYVERNAGRELQVLFAVQKLFVDLDQPTDVLSNVFTALYDEEIISEDSVYQWEQSDEEPHGKRAALSQLQGFLEWLKSLEEDNKPAES